MVREKLTIGLQYTFKRLKCDIQIAFEMLKLLLVWSARWFYGLQI